MLTTKILMSLAVLPGIFLIWKIYKKDKIEKEPMGLIVTLIIGGIVSVLPALLLELAGDSILSIVFDTESIVYIIIENLFVVACAEEGSKYFFLKKMSWKHKAFNYRFDAVVYAVAVTIGFAVLENIFYAYDGGFATAIVRAFTAVPAHTIFGIFMGHYYGQAKLCESLGDESAKKANLRKAYWVPVIFHGLYDIFASSDLIISGIAFIILVIVLDIVAFKRVKKDSAGDVEILPVDNSFEID